MPDNELETHPYLNLQTEKIAVTDRHKYTKLVVGTFPIYPITNSEPKQPAGKQMRVNWQQYAKFKYFYGSSENFFWDLLASCFNEPAPRNTEEAIKLLNNNKILISDVFKETCRKDYSPLDSGLTDPKHNKELEILIKDFNNLKIIYFTSVEVKRQFCAIFKIQFDISRDCEVQIFNRSFRLIILPTPAGRGRSVPHFFNYFPPTDAELGFKQKRQPYALAYRARYYCHYLNLPTV